MSEARLKYGGKEFRLESGVTTIGRTSDNQVSFPEDSNVSRYHAEIEERAGDHYLIDLKSSNGTTVNGERIAGEYRLKHGDKILLGGSSSATFECEEPATAANDVSSAGTPEAARTQIPTTPSNSQPAPAAKTGSHTTLLLIAAAVCCIALLFVVVAGAVYYFSGSSCNATATFVSPEQGDAIEKPTEIEIDLKNGGCVVRAVYTVDGKRFASSDEPPFTTTIDPRNFADLADGVDHPLGVILIDRDGNQIPQPNSVMLAFETRRVAPPEREPEIVVAGPQPPAGPKGKEMSLIELQQLTNGLAARLSGGRAYNVSNPQFLKEVQKKTAEYAQPGYFAKASKYRDAINVAYVREQNLDASLGYLLAMSRSKFDPAKQGTFEGLWRMSNEFVTTNGYGGLCGNEQLSDPSQNCAAMASALYMKAIVLGVFEGDMIFSAAAFGKSPQEAGVWKASLPANRTDVWSAIKTAPEREQLVRFFAAGLVAENPQKFGLTGDRPLSELYRLTL